MWCPSGPYARNETEVSCMPKRNTGFSLTELAVALAVAMILMAVSLPAFLRAYRSYQLTAAATQMADILRLTRYEAIRLNTPVNCVVQTTAGEPSARLAWSDSNGNGTQDPTEKMILLGAAGSLVDAGSVPGAAALITAAKITSGTVFPPASGSVVAFDARGAVIPPTSVTVFYLSSSLAPDAGYRAVLLMPAGSIQIWTADTTGQWRPLR